MLDLGFLEDVETILRRAPMGRQTALFSATVPAEIRRLAEHVHARPGGDQGARGHAHDRHRRAVLRRGLRPREARGAGEACIHDERPEQAIVFARTKIGVDRLARRLGDAGRAREGAARRHVPGPARRRDDRLQVRARAPARGHRRGRPRARHHGRQPRHQLRHPELPRHLRAPHRPHGPRGRERPRDHADHAQAAARARGDRAPRQDRDRGVVGRRRQAGAPREPRAARAARDAPAAAHQAARARRRPSRSSWWARAAATASSRPTWWAPWWTTRGSRTTTCATCACSSASASSRSPRSAREEVAEKVSGKRVRGTELRVEVAKQTMSTGDDAHEPRRRSSWSCSRRTRPRRSTTS